VTGIVSSYEKSPSDNWRLAVIVRHFRLIFFVAKNSYKGRLLAGAAGDWRGLAANSHPKLIIGELAVKSTFVVDLVRP